MDHWRDLCAWLSWDCAADGNRVSLHPVAIGSYHAVLGCTGCARGGEPLWPGAVFPVLGGDVGSHRVQPWLRGGVRDRLLRRTPAGPALRALHLRDAA